MPVSDRSIKILRYAGPTRWGPVKNWDSRLETSDRRLGPGEIPISGGNQPETNLRGLNSGGSVRYTDSGQNKPKPCIFRFINEYSEIGAVFRRECMITTDQGLGGAINAMGGRMDSAVRGPGSGVCGRSPGKDLARECGLARTRPGTLAMVERKGKRPRTKSQEIRT
jgi:hypothetical protein